jgi:hypothetical protein
VAMKNLAGWVVGVTTDDNLSEWKICYVVTEPRRIPWHSYCLV